MFKKPDQRWEKVRAAGECKARRVVKAGYKSQKWVLTKIIIMKGNNSFSLWWFSSSIFGPSFLLTSYNLITSMQADWWYFYLRFVMKSSDEMKTVPTIQRGNCG